MAAVGTDRLFGKVLVANRGEIACRVMQTCKRLGIGTVAVHSTADSQAKFVKMADEAVCIGPPPSLESYLCIDKIVDACKKTGAHAVHPGYGFLSERPDFSKALKQNNVVFVGPDEESMVMVSDKIQSKVLATEAKVNVIPGYQGEITSHEQLLTEANKIGYPVMVKASGGGGGKGMHIAQNDKEAVEYFELCRAEAINAFGNGTMLVEKFVDKPRHIEIQIVADRHGNTLYLPERECSIQRRNQKVLEEAPSTFIDPETRKMMGEQAAAYARRVNYVSAGTVEMMVDAKRNFYFLEMNTRLQVEHPITELITGVDLVEQMLRAAAGKELSYTQDQIKINGWATEARVCAEDPTKKYFPSIGRLTAYSEPTGEGVRVDSGILAGSQISVYYDSLIAKLCTWAPDRRTCLKRLEKALDQYVIRGLNHNVCLLRDVIHQERYLSGDITTNYLPETYPEGFVKATLSAGQSESLVLTAAALRAIREGRYMWQAQKSLAAASQRAPNAHFDTAVVVGADPKGEQQYVTLEYDYLRGAPTSAYNTNDHYLKYEIRRTPHARSHCSTPLTRASDVHAANPADDPDVISHGSLYVKWHIDSEVIETTVEPAAAAAAAGEGAAASPSAARHDILQFHGTDEILYKVQIAGSVFKMAVLEAEEQFVWQHMQKEDLHSSLKLVKAPMPGVVVDVHVKVGDQVVAGDELLTLEAMKMRNKIRAEVDGVVKSVKVSQGDKLEDAALMVEFA